MGYVTSFFDWMQHTFGIVLHCVWILIQLDLLLNAIVAALMVLIFIRDQMKEHHNIKADADNLSEGQKPIADGDSVYSDTTSAKQDSNT